MGCSVSILNPLPETLHSANTVVTASMVLCNAIPPLLSLTLAGRQYLALAGSDSYIYRPVQYWYTQSTLCARLAYRGCPVLFDLFHTFFQYLKPYKSKLSALLYKVVVI